MPDRALLTILCSRTRSPHVVGSLHLMPTGDYELRYTAPVWTLDERGGATTIAPQPAIQLLKLGEDSPGFDAYCPTCNRRMFVPADVILTSAQRGVKSFALQGRNPEARFRARLRRET